MSTPQAMTARRAEPSGAGGPTWWVVFSRELRDLWIGGKGLHLIFIYCVLLGIYSFLLASNAEVNLVPLKEMILEMVKASIAVCLLMSVVIGADSISGERERATLEGLLLTPASRRQVVFGKLLAAMSPWPVALALSVPYWAVLAKGDPVFGPAVLWTLVLGAVLVPTLAAVGLLVSIWCNTTKAAMLVSLGLYLLLLLPAESVRPGKVMTVAELRKATLLQSVNPVDAASKFLSRVLVTETPAGEVAYFLVPPAVFAVFTLVLLFGVAGPRLGLEASTARRLRSYWQRWTRPARARTPRPVRTESAEVALPGLPALPAIPETRRTDDRPRMQAGPLDPSAPARTWWLVLRKELRDLWIGGKALNLIIAYTVILGVYSYWMAHDSTLSLIPPKEMVFELLKAAMVVSVFMGLIIGADSLSGERERATLEGLLVTPASRRQIVVGKFLAAVSTWPVALAISVPYLRVLSQGDEAFTQGALWAVALGSILTPAFTALGMLVSFWCNTNKSSMFVSLAVYLVFLLPTQLPGHAQGGFMGLLFQGLNPMAATRHFLARILVNNRAVAESWTFLVSPVVLCVLLLAFLWYGSPGLRLEAGRVLRSRRQAFGALMIGCVVALLTAAPLGAQAARGAGRPPVQIDIDMAAKVVRAGTPVLFNTVLSNHAAEATPPLTVAMNIINLNAKGEVVDPEDWSPQRTQYLEQLAPGQSANLSWRVNAILDGDFMVYMVAIPKPAGAESTSQPVTSSGIHLTVTPFTKLNPRGVLPYAIGGPVVLGVLILLAYRHRRRQIDMGGAR